MMFKLPSTATTSLSVWPRNQVRKHREVDKRRRATASSVGEVAAVADEIKSQLAIGGFHGCVHLFAGRFEAAVTHHQFEMRDRAFDRLVHLLLVRQRRAFVGQTLTGPAGRFSTACWMIFRLSRISAMRT